MRATEILSEEHKVIERALSILETGKLESGDAARLLDFFSGFADHCHHAKEENLFFPALEKNGVPRDEGPIGCMLKEHEQGRALRKEMADALAAGDKKKFESAAGQFASLLREHIFKEDNILFKIAEEVLDKNADEDLCAQFENAEHEVGKHEHYIKLVEELERKAIDVV